MKKRIVQILIGSLMIVTVLIGYLPQIEYVVEMTCISNTLGGLLLIVDGIFDMAKKKTFLHIFYLNIAVSILIVFLICMGSLTGIYKFNFHGAFFFMHVINPIMFIICYMIFINEQIYHRSHVLTAPLMIMLYLVFDYIRFQFTGKFVYGFIEVNAFTLGYVIMIGIAVYVCVCLLGLSLFVLNRFIHKKFIFK